MLSTTGRPHASSRLNLSARPSQSGHVPTAINSASQAINRVCRTSHDEPMEMMIAATTIAHTIGPVMLMKTKLNPSPPITAPKVS